MIAVYYKNGEDAALGRKTFREIWNDGVMWNVPADKIAAYSESKIYDGRLKGDYQDLFVAWMEARVRPGIPIALGRITPAILQAAYYGTDWRKWIAEDHKYQIVKFFVEGCLSGYVDYVMKIV